MASASRIIDLQRPAGNAMLQRHAVQKLHGDEGLAVLLADVVNGADVGMIQRGRGLRFALKAGQRLRIAGNVFGQELQGDEAVQPRVLGLVNHAHPAAAQLLDDAVVRDGLADHLWPIIFGRSRLADHLWLIMESYHSRLNVKAGPCIAGEAIFNPPLNRLEGSAGRSEPELI